MPSARHPLPMPTAPRGVSAWPGVGSLVVNNPRNNNVRLPQAGD